MAKNPKFQSIINTMLGPEALDKAKAKEAASMAADKEYADQRTAGILANPNDSGFKQTTDQMFQRGFYAPEKVKGRETEASRQERRDAGQTDISMMTPMLLDTLMQRQRNRRRGYAGTILGGFGLEDEESRRPTLLGS